MIPRKRLACLLAGLLLPTMALGAAAATPRFSPAAGTYTGSQAVTITDSTPGARIHYTTNGSTPTTSSALYSGPIAIAKTTTIKAIAAASGYTNSAVATATYTLVVPAPTFSPAGGTFSAAQSIAISASLAGARIYYTTNGTTPTTSSTLYSGPVAVTRTTTLKAIAAATGLSTSAVASATYTLVVPAPTFSPAAGTYSSAQTVAISDALAGARIYYTTNGTTPTTSSTLYSGPLAVSATRTLKAIAASTGWTTSAVASATYTIAAPAAAKPGLSPPPGAYPGRQRVTLSSSTPGATIYFTDDGTAPTTASQVYTGTPLTTMDGITIRAIAVAPGYSQSAVSGGTYSIAFGLSGLSSDLVVSGSGTGPVSTAPFSTTSARALLLAFVSSSGPAAGTQSASVTGAGLDWTLIARANSQPGTAEVWAAAATAPLSNVTVQSTPGVVGFSQLLTVEVVTGSYDYEALVGASATVSASSGPPSIALAPTGSGSWFLAVGSDAATSLPRIAGASQTIVAEYADASSPAALWVQQLAVNVPDPGASLLLNDTVPTSSAHNLAAVEIRRSISFDGIGRASLPWDVLPHGGSYPGPVAATAGGPPGATFQWKYVWSNPLEPYQYYGAPILRQTTGSVYICEYCPSCPCVDTYYAIAAPPAGIANESTVGARGFETVRTPQFSTNGFGGKLLLAFVTSGGPPDVPQAASVSGAGLTWSLLERSNARQGTAEVWAAYAEFPLTLVSLESTQDVPGYLQQLTVVTLDGATVGTTTAASGPSGSAGAGLTSTDDGSWFFAAGASISSLGYPQWQHWVTQLATPAGPRGTSVAMDSLQTAINSTWDDYLGASTSVAPWNMVALEVRGPLAPPLFSPPAGTAFPGGFPVSIASPSPDATIYFTTDGSRPSRSSTAYQGPIHLTGPATIKAVAFAAGATSSDVATATYTVAEPPLPGGMLASVFTTAQGIGPVTTAPFSTSGAPRLLLAFVSTAGPSGAPQTATVNSAGTSLTWTLLQRANGQPGSAEIWAATPPGALTNVTIRAEPAHPGFQQLLTVVGFSGGAASIGSAGSASGAPELNLLPGLALVPTAGGSWFFGVGSDAAIGERRSTLGGQPVLAELTDAVGGSDHWVQAWAVPGGAPGSSAAMGVAGPRYASWNFAGVEVRPPAGASPVLAPPPGTYVAPQTVALSSATPGLAIHYTTDGSPPGSGSPLYQGPVELATTATVRAVAQGGGGYATSEVSAGHYALCMPTACTAYSVAGSACVPAHAPSTAPCDDGNPCTRDDRCNGSGQCTGGAAVPVDDGNACTADGCDPLEGVTHVPLAAGATCSDGNSCNGSEICNGAGQCLAGTPPPLDDGDPCTADSCHSVTGVLHTPIPNCSVLPPDPAVVATTINATRATDIASSTSFLYEGPNPVQYR